MGKKKTQNDLESLSFVKDEHTYDKKILYGLYLYVLSNLKGLSSTIQIRINSSQPAQACPSLPLEIPQCCDHQIHTYLVFIHFRLGTVLWYSLWYLTFIVVPRVLVCTYLLQNETARFARWCTLNVSRTTKHQLFFVMNLWKIISFYYLKKMC